MGGGSARCCARWGVSGRWRRLPGRAGAGPGPQTPHARARRPHWSPQSHAGRRRGRPHPPSEPPSSGLSAGSGRDRSMSTLKVYSTSVTGSREVSGAWGRAGRPGGPFAGWLSPPHAACAFCSFPPCITRCVVPVHLGFGSLCCVFSPQKRAEPPGRV